MKMKAQRELTLSVGSVFDKTKLLYKHHTMQLVRIYVHVHVVHVYTCIVDKVNAHYNSLSCEQQMGLDVWEYKITHRIHVRHYGKCTCQFGFWCHWWFHYPGLFLFLIFSRKSDCLSGVYTTRCKISPQPAELPR